MILWDFFETLWFYYRAPINLLRFKYQKFQWSAQVILWHHIQNTQQPVRFCFDVLLFCFFFSRFGALQNRIPIQCCLYYCLNIFIMPLNVCWCVCMCVEDCDETFWITTCAQHDLIALPYRIATHTLTHIKSFRISFSFEGENPLKIFRIKWTV